MRRPFVAVLMTLSMPLAARSAALPQIPPARSIPLGLAMEASRTALDACTARGSPATVEIVDLNGLTKVVLSADGARTSSFDYVRRKAYTVLRKGVSSRDSAGASASCPRTRPRSRATRT